jgi:hypothetical protein
MTLEVYAHALPDLKTDKNRDEDETAPTCTRQLTGAIRVAREDTITA